MAKDIDPRLKEKEMRSKDTRPSAKLSYARVSVQKACFVLDAIRGKDVTTALGIMLTTKICFKRYREIIKVSNC